MLSSFSIISFPDAGEWILTFTTNDEAEIKDAARLFETSTVPALLPVVITFRAFVEPIEPSAGASLTTLDVAPLKSTSS
jgi:hypothetical protein